jgi:hypothetical protein
LALIAVFGVTISSADGIGRSSLPPSETDEFLIDPVTLTQSLSQTIVALNSVSCNNQTTNSHTDNWYMRRYDLDGQHGILGPFGVTSVSFGVEFAQSGFLIPPTQPMTVRLHTIPAGDPLLFGNLNLLAEENFQLGNMQLGMWQVMISGTVADPLIDDLVVEVFSPNGQANGHIFFIGSNPDGEIAPSYLAAPDCNVNQPTPTGAIGFPGMNMLINVTGTEEPTQVVAGSWGKIKSFYR